MGQQKFADGSKSLAICDVCSFQYRKKDLRPLVVKTKVTHILACPACYVEDQPQLLVGMYPVVDPQAIQNPRPDTSYWQSGPTGLQTQNINPPDPNAVSAFGYPAEGSRQIQWGWNPIGLGNPLGLPSLPNALQASGVVGGVTIAIT